jgi:hypothetical protein
VSKGSLITLGAAVLLGGVLLSSTLSSQKVECSAVVTYEGRTDSATASAADNHEAERQARTTACGTISSGMDGRIACSNTPPVRVSCRNL